jgi:hypothetical protein
MGKYGVSWGYMGVNAGRAACAHLLQARLTSGKLKEWLKIGAPDECVVSAMAADWNGRGTSAFFFGSVGQTTGVA